MKKATYLAAVLLATTSTSWAAPQCVPWDYARIKDAKRDDLIQLVCASDQKAMENRNEARQAIVDGGFNWKKESDAATHAQEVCQDQEDQARTVLKEKFGKIVKDAECSPQ